MRRPRDLRTVVGMARRSTGPFGTAIASALAGALLAAACGGGNSTDADDPFDAAPTPDAVPPDADTGEFPRIEPGPCQFDVPTTDGLVEGVDYDCGDLIAVKDRDAGTGRVALHYFRGRSTRATGRMTVWLDGGPGGSGQRMVDRFASTGNAFRDDIALVDGDFIVLAQRGTRLARPSLVYDWYDTDLGPYNTGASADDVDDLRAALGYDLMNVWGVSYGSRLGLEVLRRHGDRVRAASLGGLVPPDVAWVAEIPRSFESALDALNVSCELDLGCGAAFGDLKAKFIAGVYDLAKSPVSIDHPDGAFDFDGGWYASTLFSALYARSTYAWLPLLVSDLAERRTDRVAEFLSAYLDAQAGREGVSGGLYDAIVCGEQFNPPDPAQPEAAEFGVDPDILAFFAGSWNYRVEDCPSLELAAPRPVLSQPVASGVPTLIDSGALDPITPPTFGDVAAETLTDTTVVVIANSGHGALMQSPCGNAILGAFLADPAAPVDTDCAAEVTTDYVLPAALVGRAIPRAAMWLEVEDGPARR